MAGTEQAWSPNAIQRYGTGQFNQDLEVEQWDDVLHNLFLEADNSFVPFIDQFGGGSLGSDSYKLEWGEYDQEIISMTVASGSSSTIVVATNEWKPLIKDDILHCPTTEEYLIVTATPTTTTVAVKKLSASSISSSLAAGDYAAGVVYYRLYTQKQDGQYLGGSTKYTGIASHRLAATRYNYIGTFEKYVQLTRAEFNQPWRYAKAGSGLTLEDHQLAVKMKEMLDEQEYHAWLGKLVNVAGTTHVAMGNGLLNFDNIQTESGTEGYTWRNFSDWVRNDIKAKNRKNNIPVMCNPQGFAFVQNMLLSTFNANISGLADKNTAGMDYYKVVVGPAQLELYINRALGELFPSDSVFVGFDPTKIFRRHINNMNLETRYNVQAKDAEVRLHKIFGTQGWELANAETLAKLVLTPE